MDFIPDVYICKDQAIFDALQLGHFGYIRMGKILKMKIEGIGRICLKLHNGAIKTVFNVKFVPTSVVNIISLGELATDRYKYVGIGNSYKLYKRNNLVI